MFRNGTNSHKERCLYVNWKYRNSNENVEQTI